MASFQSRLLEVESSTDGVSWPDSSFIDSLRHARRAPLVASVSDMVADESTEEAKAKPDFVDCSHVSPNCRHRKSDKVLAN